MEYYERFFVHFSAPEASVPSARLDDRRVGARGTGYHEYHRGHPRVRPANGGVRKGYVGLEGRSAPKL